MTMAVSQLSIPDYKRKDNIILSASCDEPDGLITRHVRLLRMTPDNLRIFWEKARLHRTLFSEEIRDDFERFANVIFYQVDKSIDLNGVLYVIDDFVGVFFLTDTRLPVDGLVHYTFFDGRHRGRTQLVIKMLQYAFIAYKFRRLTTEVPMYAKKQTHNFVRKSLGFKFEGRRRKARLFDGEWFDVISYGILNEEVLGDKSPYKENV